MVFAVNTTTATTQGLRDSAWAMGFFGYTAERRSAFWQMIQSAGVPCVRLTPHKIMFDEQQVRDFIARRSTGKGAQ